jgi:hypothetical protein
VHRDLGDIVLVGEIITPTGERDVWDQKAWLCLFGHVSERYPVEDEVAVISDDQVLARHGMK